MSARTHGTILVPLLALLAGAALAAPAQWQAVASSTGGMVEIDKSRIGRLKSGQTAAWTRLTLDRPALDFENQLRYTAVQALNHYDCASSSFATQRRIFLLDGREIKTEKVSGPRQMAIQSDSLDARLLAEACKPRTVGEMRQTADRVAAVAAQSNGERPRVMHAEMVSAGDLATPRGVKVADGPAAPAAPAAEKPRFIELPVIDKSKAEDPLKGATPAPAPASAAAAPRAAPAARTTIRPAVPAVPLASPELSRQQRELLLATSGPRKAVAKKKPVEPPPPPPPDYSRVQWGYAGLGAPENWGKLRPNYAVCATGKRQSPIDIRGGIRVDLEPIKFDYRATHFRIVDTGHTVQVEVGEGSSITVMGRNYPLTHIHFHRPAEERIDGKTYDMSAHLVHRDYDGTTAVIAIPMERGSEHPLVQTLWNHMPLEVGMEVMPPNVVIDLSRLLPESREYFTYMGSLTTPPCTENVLWMVFKNPVQVSPAQIGIFARLYPNNARPIQPLHDRLIKGPR